MRPLQSEPSAKAEAWRAYRIAFQDFSRKVLNVQALKNQQNVNDANLDLSLVELEKASMTYTSSRNALVQHLLPPSQWGFLSEGLVDCSQLDAARVRRIAELLWDLRGRPEGSADDNWLRAREIIGRTMAAKAVSC